LGLPNALDGPAIDPARSASPGTGPDLALLHVVLAASSGISVTGNRA